MGISENVCGQTERYYREQSGTSKTIPAPQMLFYDEKQYFTTLTKALKFAKIEKTVDKTKKACYNNNVGATGDGCFLDSC